MPEGSSRKSGRPWEGLGVGGPGGPESAGALRCSRKLQARKASRKALRGLKGPSKKDDSKVWLDRSSFQKQIKQPRAGPVASRAP